METLKTYKFYDPETKERLGIFADLLELKSGDELEITVIPCHKNDQFSREISNFLFSMAEYAEPIKGMRKFRIPVLNGKPKATFLRFCKECYVRKFEETFITKVPQGFTFDVIAMEVINSDKLSEDKIKLKIGYFA